MIRLPLFFLISMYVVACSAVVTIDPNELGGDGGVRDDAGRAEDGFVARDGGGPDMSLVCEDGCDDEVACTVDECTDGNCTHTRDNTLCGDEQRCDAVDGCVDAACETPADCDDGFVCNGVEMCVAGLCVNGDDVVCDETNECTVGRCNEETDGCEYMRQDARCADDHPCTTDTCGEMGCEHTPDHTVCNDGFCMMGGMCDVEMGCMGSTAVVCEDDLMCTSNRCDPMVGACVFDMIDDDGDGYGPADDCGSPRDCDDANGAIHPGATEMCNSIDDDCDGMTDEGVCGPPDTCDTMEVLTFGADGTAHAEGAFATLADEGRSACGQSGGHDAIYAIDVEANVDYVLDTTLSDGDTVLAVSDTCGSWEFAGLGCNDDAVRGQGGSRIYLRRLRPGRIFILVDQYGGTTVSPALSFVLNIVSFPAPAEACAARPDITAGGTVVGRIRRGSPHESEECGTNGNERETSFHTRVRNGVAQGYSDDFNAEIYVRQMCGGPAIACGHDGREINVPGDSPFGSGAIITVDGARNGGLYSLKYQPNGSPLPGGGG